MTFAGRRNLLTTHFSERILAVKRRMTVQHQSTLRKIRSEGRPKGLFCFKLLLTYEKGRG